MNQSAHMRGISLAVLALVATLLVAVPQPAAALSTYLNVDQLDVNTFIDAGTAVSQRSFTPEGTDAVVLATDGNFPDGLTASAVAGAVDAPVLFTRILDLPTATAQEIDRLLDPGDTVYLMGGTVAISPAVANQLAEDYTVVRLAGDTRLETAVEAAELVGVDEESPTVIIARAFGPDGANTPSDRTTGWVDAISCGAFAAATSTPILLTETDVLSGTTEDALRALDPDDAIICGGAAAISDSTVTAIRSLGIDTERVEGPTRVETAIDAARTLFGATTAAAGTFAVVPGYGESFGYGLAAAPLGLPILLVGQSEPTLCTDGSQPSRETLCYLRTAGEDTAQLVVVGGEDVIADAVVDALGAAAGGRDLADIPLLSAPQNVTATDDINDDGTQATVTWNAVADPDEILAGYQVFVDGEPSGDPVPAETTTAVATGLTPDEEASITVAAVDVGDRVGATSAPALVTATDEVPEAITNFEAAPRDNAVQLSWDAGPTDTARYTLTRAAEDDLLGIPLGCQSYEALTEITERSTTSYLDDTAVNGTGYCYRITVTDAADQTSPATTTAAVTPQPGVPNATVLSPTGQAGTLLGSDDRDTVYSYEPLVIEYVLRDSDTPVQDLRVVWEVSTDSGATYAAIADPDNGVPQFTDQANGVATFRVLPCSAPNAGAGCIEPATRSGAPFLQYRVTVADQEDRASRASTGGLLQALTPGPVTGQTALPGNALATVSWEFKDWFGPAPLRYEVLQDTYSAQPGSEADAGDCSTQVGDYDSVAVVDQPNPRQDRLTRVISGLANGTAQIDTIYCFRIRGLSDGQTGPTVVTAANPDAGIQGAIGWIRPVSGTPLDRGQAETLSFSIDTPDGVTPQRITIQYCANYDTGPQNRCEDVNGNGPVPFTEIPDGALSGPALREGPNSRTWTVPADDTTLQSTNGRARFIITLETSSGPAGSATVSGVIFR